MSLTAYSHKTRELLILACTDIEAHWKYHLERAGVMPAGQGFTTNDYVGLRDPLHIREYSVSLPRYSEIPDLRPFFDWSTEPGPTQTIPWYDAYNKAKHDRHGNFAEATLLACIQAIAANIVMFSVRFGPFRLYNGGGMLSALFNPMFDVSLVDCDPKSFYVPELDVAAHVNLTWGHADILARNPMQFRL